MKSKLINDKFKKSRGGKSKLLEILCAYCGVLVCRYQKDGPGHLKRMYVDRMRDCDCLPSSKTTLKNPLSSLKCKSCGHLLGVSMVYKKENRPAFHLVVGAIKKGKN